MKRLEKIWVPAVALVALVCLYAVFSEYQRLEEREAWENALVLEGNGADQARRDAATDELRIFLVWKDDQWVAPGIEGHDDLPFEQVLLESTQKIDRYNDSSGYRRAALRWATQYNQEAMLIQQEI